MSVDLSNAQWVAIAWAELLLVYAGYLGYLRWLKRKKASAEGNE